MIVLDYMEYGSMFLLKFHEIYRKHLVGGNKMYLFQGHLSNFKFTKVKNLMKQVKFGVGILPQAQTSWLFVPSPQKISWESFIVDVYHEILEKYQVIVLVNG